ncbi:MAG: SUMF1/EgtB/PvdO family nonheme iron enzyme [Verrucomicrobiales bacterium]|nr:SUMF1/EgtB/PvdO family nonheme iron enzyme [Verrucomicrobiales bacterium]
MKSPDPGAPQRGRRTGPPQRPGGSGVDQSRQEVRGGQANYNFQGPTTIHGIHGSPASDEALAALSKRLDRIRRSGLEELVHLERVFGMNIRDLDRSYVVPDFQDFNPPDEVDSPSLNVSREPAFNSVDRFIRRENLKENGQRILFVLGDAGMGKTSLLLMLKFRHLTSLFPTDHHCVLLKLGPDTEADIKAIEDPVHTVLLLDSLDEDPEAHGHASGAAGRLEALLPLVCRFHRVILTCRTQFFPETSRHFTTLDGHFMVGDFECPLKYLSLFAAEQVDAYLRKRFRRGQVWRKLRTFVFGDGGDPLIEEARKAALAFESLRLRPLLLSYIDDFVRPDGGATIDFRNRYAVYDRLVREWLRRDAKKLAGLPSGDGWQVATLLAIHLTRLGVRRLAREEFAKVPGLAKVDHFRIENRSLLSRTDRADGFSYQFAHRTIQEFLVARAILSDDGDYDLEGVGYSAEALRFILDGMRFLGKSRINLRGAGGRDLELAVQWLRWRFGIDLVAIPHGSFWMGSPEGEKGRHEHERRHWLRLTRSYWLGRYPVTQRCYAAVMGKPPNHFNGEERPVDSVTWYEAEAFCERLTALAREAGVMGEGMVFRLPTEAEWEYACRAGTESAFNDGSACTEPEGDHMALNRLGWYAMNSAGEAHPVGEKEPNGWGLYDLHGNVWEWCADRAEWNEGVVTDTYVDGVEDPMNWNGAERVVRGGSYWGFAGFCRSACRLTAVPGDRYVFLGFRLAAGEELASGASVPEPEDRDAEPGPA